MVVVVGRWSLFGGGRYLRFDCMFFFNFQQIVKHFKFIFKQYIAERAGCVISNVHVYKY